MEHDAVRNFPHSKNDSRTRLRLTSTILSTTCLPCRSPTKAGRAGPSRRSFSEDGSLGDAPDQFYPRTFRASRHGIANFHTLNPTPRRSPHQMTRRALVGRTTKEQLPELGGNKRPSALRKISSTTRSSRVARSFAFDDLSQSRYDKLWRISVLPLIVSFLFRTVIRWINAHGIWSLVAGRQKLRRHWQLPPLVWAVVLPIKSSRPICTRSSCVKNARNVANALRPPQSLGNGHANERAPRRNRSQQSKIDLPSHTASADATAMA